MLTIATTVRCENCGGTDWVSLAVAGIALVVSLASLYLTSLRRADVECDLIAEGSQIGDGGFMNEHPDDRAITACVFLSNSGAHGAVVISVTVGGFRYIGAQPALWQDITAPHDIREVPLIGLAKRFPIVLDAGEGETLFIRSALAANPARGDGEAYARSVAGLQAVELTVTWSFMRSATPLSKAIRQRRTEYRHSTVRLDGTAFREDARAFWRANPAYEHLADAMEPDPGPSAQSAE